MVDHLFSPIQLGTLDLPNRIAVAPMCQYSADDGCASDWHIQHWMNLAMSGAGMVTVEEMAPSQIPLRRRQNLTAPSGGKDNRGSA